MRAGSKCRWSALDVVPVRDGAEVSHHEAQLSASLALWPLNRHICKGLIHSYLVLASFPACHTTVRRAAGQYGPEGKLKPFMSPVRHSERRRRLVFRCAD